LLVPMASITISPTCKGICSSTLSTKSRLN
jgi:hypothetical protein